MLEFKFNPTDLNTNEELKYVSKIEIDNKFHYFTGVSTEVYLFVHLDKNLENNFQFKKFDDTTNKVFSFFVFV